MDRTKLFFTFSVITLVNCKADIRWKFAEKHLEEVLTSLKLSKYLALLEQARLDRELWKSGRLTLFAPTDAAFENLDRLIGGQRLSGEALRGLLRFHMAEDEWISKSWTNEQLIPTRLSGSNIRVNLYNGTEQDLLTVSGSPVIVKDLHTKNGIIHVLSSVIYPIPVANAFDTAIAIPECQKFIRLAGKIELSRQLRYTDGITVFLPVDRAFKKLPNTFLANIESEFRALAALLRYHVVNGTYHIQGLTSPTRLKTWEDSYLHTDYAGAGEKHLLIINRNSKVVSSYPVSNGVIHVIDSLLIIPPTNSPKQLLYSRKKQTQFR